MEDIHSYQIFNSDIAHCYHTTCKISYEIDFIKMMKNQLYPSLPNHVDDDSISILQSIDDYTKDYTNNEQSLQEKKKEIERETLESSLRSLQHLHESEKAGVATAEELYRQKEQLFRTEAKIDGMNTTLQRSEYHIRGIRSIFGGIRNKFSSSDNSHTSSLKKNELQLPDLKDCSKSGSILNMKSKSVSSIPNSRDALFDEQLCKKQERFRSISQSRSDNVVNKALNDNLDEMSSRLNNLTNLGKELNNEIEGQNLMLDRIKTKTTNTDLKVRKQNSDMKRFLK